MVDFRKEAIRAAERMVQPQVSPGSEKNLLEGKESDHEDI